MLVIAWLGSGEDWFGERAKPLSKGIWDQPFGEIKMSECSGWTKGEGVGEIVRVGLELLR